MKTFYYIFQLIAANFAFSMAMGIDEITKLSGGLFYPMKHDVVSPHVDEEQSEKDAQQPICSLGVAQFI